MFTPVETTAGALLLHLATTSLLFDAGAILGASGLLRRLLRDPKNEIAQQTTTLWFFFGMALATVFVKSLTTNIVPSLPALELHMADLLKITVAGSLTGWGTKHCGGCTSGHMLCGIGRMSPRSLLATAIFFPTAVATFHLSSASLATAACPSEILCYKAVYPSSHEISYLTGLLILAVGLLAYGQSRNFKDADTRKSFAIAGFIFALGLLISGMADPSKIQSFFAIQFSPLKLDAWDPSLCLIILFALLPNILTIQLRGFEKPPRWTTSFSLPTKTMADVDAKFVFGAISFGIAWGLTGTCPGPAVVRSLLQPAWGILWMSGFYFGSLDIFGS